MTISKCLGLLSQAKLWSRALTGCIPTQHPVSTWKSWWTITGLGLECRLEIFQVRIFDNVDNNLSSQYLPSRLPVTKAQYIQIVQLHMIESTLLYRFQSLNTEEQKTNWTNFISVVGFFCALSLMKWSRRVELKICLSKTFPRAACSTLHPFNLLQNITSQSCAKLRTVCYEGPLLLPVLHEFKETESSQIRTNGQTVIFQRRALVPSQP